MRRLPPEPAFAGSQTFSRAVSSLLACIGRLPSISLRAGVGEGAAP
jgi:hypothetical protein